MTPLRKTCLAACINLSWIGCGGTPTAPTPRETGLTVLAINKPGAGLDLDGPTTLVEGTFQPADLKGDIWVVVRPQMDFDNVYPQSGNAPAGAPATKNSNGTWSVPATFGGPPQYFDIIAVQSADTSALGRLSDAVKQSGKVPYSAISGPPFTLSPAVRITRKPLATFIDPAGDTSIAAATIAITVRGKFPQGVNDDIWLLVFPELAPGIAYPQSPNAAAGLPAAKDGAKLEWSVPVAFGGPPQSYELRVYTANASASALLSANLRASVASGNSGIPESTLPTRDGLFEQSKIKVTRR